MSYYCGSWESFEVLFIIYFFLSLCCLEQVFPISISPEDACIISNKIWKNECAGSCEGLTHWNKGENFASLGIGHFIWYPLGRQEQFQETFPNLLLFLQKEKVAVPAWLQTAQGCPWISREDFYENINSEEMNVLRKFLFETKDLQAIFIANRLEKTFPLLIENLPLDERERISTIFYQLSKDPNGLYALIDYMNFKGAGSSSSEMYNGQGWGLLQVLRRMQVSSQNPLVDFVASAKAVLIERVKNSPPERGEERWLKGWLNRLETYTVVL